MRKLLYILPVILILGLQPVKTMWILLLQARKRWILLILIMN